MADRFLPCSKEVIVARRSGSLVSTLAVVGLVVTACTPAPQLNVPPQDPTSPSALWLQANIPNQPLVNVTLGGTPAAGEMVDTNHVSITARADDPDGGIRAIRIWATTRRSMPGTVQGPTLAGTPEVERVSSATVGQPANPTESVTWELDVEPLIGAFWDLSLDVFAEAENFHGGKVTTPVLTLHVRRVGLRLRVIALSNDDGTRAPQVTAAQFTDVVARVNRVFRGSGIRFLYDPAADWQPINSTGMNQDATIAAGGNAFAATLPGRIPLLLRWGSAADPTGNGNAYPPPGAGTLPANVTDADQRYVALPSLYPTTGLSFLTLGNGSFVAHELGHYLGLYHTFPGWDGINPMYGTSTGSAAAADLALITHIGSNGGTIDALDGDRLPDTPPDPGTFVYDLHGNSDGRADEVCTSSQVTVSGTIGGNPVSFTFDPDVRNVMSYHAMCGTGDNPEPQKFTPDQVRQMHRTLTVPQRNHLLSPP